MHKNRSNRVRRGAAATALAVIAVGVGGPASAAAQQVTPTGEQYDNGVLAVSGGGSGGDPASAVDSSSGQLGELPFTGLDVAAIAAVGIGLVGAGFAVRRVSRSGEDQAV